MRQGLGVPKQTFTWLGQLILVGQKDQLMLIIIFCTIELLCLIAKKSEIKNFSKNRDSLLNILCLVIRTGSLPLISFV